MMFKRHFEVRVVKDDKPTAWVAPPSIVNITIDGRGMLENALKFYGAYKMINLSCDMMQHVVVRTLP
jgi:hypothetical protein